MQLLLCPHKPWKLVVCDDVEFRRRFLVNASYCAQSMNFDFQVQLRGGRIVLIQLNRVITGSLKCWFRFFDGYEKTQKIKLIKKVNFVFLGNVVNISQQCLTLKAARCPCRIIFSFLQKVEYRWTARFVGNAGFTNRSVSNKGVV